MTDDFERLRWHANYLRRNARGRLASDLDRLLDEHDQTTTQGTVDRHEEVDGRHYVVIETDHRLDLAIDQPIHIEGVTA